MSDITEREWRKSIAEQVRRNCTLDWETVKKGGDALIYAVCDWIENPPEWSSFEAPHTTGVERFADLAAAQFDSDLYYDGAEIKRRIQITAHLIAPDHPARAEDCAVCRDDDRLDVTPEIAAKEDDRRLFPNPRSRKSSDPLDDIGLNGGAPRW